MPLDASVPLLQVKDLQKVYTSRSTHVCALQSINLEIKKGETLGLVGESGCGKSTLGRLILGLDTPTKGSIFYEGSDIHTLNKREQLELRRKMQVVFQDPFSSLNPQMSVESIIGEGLDIHKLAYGAARKNKIVRLLEQVSLDSNILDKRPHQFSGGQRQRIAIARALAVDPEFLVCDESLSALDAYTQRQISYLLIKLKTERNLTSLFISHDLNAVRKLADNIAVMYLGNIVEIGKTEEIFKNPKHPYTQALINAIPLPDPRKERSNLGL